MPPVPPHVLGMSLPPSRARVVPATASLGILGPTASNGGAFWRLAGSQDPNLARNVAPGPSKWLQIAQPPTVCRPIQPRATPAGLRFHGDGRGTGDPVVFLPSATLWRANLRPLRFRLADLHVRLAFLCAGIPDLQRRARMISAEASGVESGSARGAWLAQTVSDCGPLAEGPGFGQACRAAQGTGRRQTTEVVCLEPAALTSTEGDGPPVWRAAAKLV